MILFGLVVILVCASFIHEENRWKEYMIHSIIESSISRDILMLTRIDSLH
jgi:hypothetical protein